MEGDSHDVSFTTHASLPTFLRRLEITDEAFVFQAAVDVASGTEVVRTDGIGIFVRRAFLRSRSVRSLSVPL
jgi:hypothetical protein